MVVVEVVGFGKRDCIWLIGVVEVVVGDMFGYYIFLFGYKVVF